MRIIRRNKVVDLDWDIWQKRKGNIDWMVEASEDQDILWYFVMISGQIRIIFGYDYVSNYIIKVVYNQIPLLYSGS